MWSPPSDVDGECNAHLYVSDSYGDGETTFRCQLLPCHDGVHRERFERQHEDKAGRVVVEWEHDEKPLEER